MRKTFRITLVIGMVLTIAMLGGPANASPLQSVTASAYGLSIAGLVAVPPTPTITGTFPPAATNQNSSLLTIPADPLVFSGTATVRSVTSNDSNLASTVPSDRITVVGGGTVPAAYNARGYARIEGLTVLASNPATPDTTDTLGTAIVEVGAVEAEALVSCVNGAAVIATGSRLIGPLRALGLDLTLPVDNLVGSVVDVLNIPGVLTARKNVVTSTGNGAEVIGLQITVLGTGLVVNLAEARVAGGTCGGVPQCSDGIDNDGDGRIDIADPECHTDGNPNNPASYDPNDNSEAGLLPRTGGNGPALGLTLLGLGSLMLLGSRKLRRNEAG